MVRRIFSVLLVLALAAGIVYAYLGMRSEQAPKSAAIDAIPKNAVLILETGNPQSLWNQASTNNMIWEEFQAVPSLQRADSLLNALDSAFTADADLQKQLDRTNFTLSLHPVGAHNFAWLFSFGVPNTWNKAQTLKALEQFVGKNPDSQTYDGSTIFTSKNSQLHYAFEENQLILSPDKSLIQESVRHIKSGVSITQDIDFDKVRKTAGSSAEANLFVQHDKLFSFVGESLKESFQVEPFYATWSTLDLEVKPNALFLNGYSLQTDSVYKYLTVFQNQDQRDFGWFGELPASTAFATVQQVENQSEFRRNLNDYYEESGSLAFRNGKINNLEQICDCDLWQTFSREWDGRIAHVLLEPSGVNEPAPALNVFGAKDTSSLLQNWSTFLSPHPELPTYRGIPIYYFALPSSVETLFGELFEGSAKVVSVLENKVIFSENLRDMQTFLANYSTGRTLENDASFREYKSNLAGEFNLMFYNNIARSPFLFARMLKEKNAERLLEFSDQLRKLQALTLQVSYSRDGLYYNNLYLKYNPVYKQQTSTLWEIALETGFNFKPELVTNHYTNAQEVFFQDKNNTVYLISPTGKILWQKEMPGKIMSPVRQIDIFKNGKLQMVFNTKDAIHCLDRNGNTVEGFPIRLPAEATSPLSVFDYDNNKDYRLVVACADRSIRNYDASGNAVKGWNASKTENLVNAPLKHIRVKTKDYIFALEETGKVHLLARTGETRFNPKSNVQHYAGSEFTIINGKSISETRMIYPDTLGNIVELEFGNGEVEFGLTGIAEGSFITFADINNDSKKDYIIADGNELRVYDSSREKLFEKEFEGPITYSPQAYSFGSNDVRVGITVAEVSKCYLINNDGEMTDEFPLFGNTPFSIGDLNKTGDWNLVIGDTLGNVLTYSLE
ncbi:hypothetical protein [Halocola ammonii]